jgi:hypothetical protein
VASLFGPIKLTYTPEGGSATAIDLSCLVRPGVTFDAPTEVIDDPVLCDPSRSRVRAGAASVSLTLVVGDDYATTVDTILGTSGRLEARVGEDGAGFGATVSWPSVAGVAFTDDQFVEMELTLGSSAPEYLPATTTP